ncbi:putative RNA-directed DNA polymerase from transposon X-element [Trichonephila inaurata madagascariensis]|uniref:Putative RNA-directed DNA polymerase from transposon X-element n=1 Tax=Trichonephila inaurata madagascariensis TaxID=2747483 RepID=A0A8X7BUY7_9ARAC|nr:putative RNA-directed DNA polymerase from transposon X-element [Trichonephila inaurata madagascariensis]
MLTEFNTKSTNWKITSATIALQETFLRPNIGFNFPNYSTYRNDRLTHRGGGTAILVKNSIAHHAIEIFTTAIDITTIEIEGPSGNITVCSLYRPPKSPRNSFIPDLIKIFRNRTQCIVVGDFNAKHPSWNLNRRGNDAGYKLLKYTKVCGYVISAPADPTRIPRHQNHLPSVIDFGVSCGLSNITVESKYDLSSDHNPVHFVVNFNFNNSHLLNCKTIINWHKFQDILSTTIVGNPPINNIDDIEEAISNLNYNIHTAINQSSKFKSMKQDFTLQSLNRHIKTFHSVSSYICAVCKRTFNRIDNLRRHQSTAHGCPFVQTTSTSESSSRISVHPYSEKENAASTSHATNDEENTRPIKLSNSTRKKVFNCFECGKVFYQRNSLNQHAKTVHAAASSFLCPVCDKNCVTVHGLIRHLNMHATNGEENVPSTSTENNPPQMEVGNIPLSNSFPLIQSAFKSRIKTLRLDNKDHFLDIKQFLS